MTTVRALAMSAQGLGGFVPGSPGVSHCVPPGSEQSKDFLIITRSLNVLTSSVPGIFYRFPFFDNLAFFTPLHGSSFHRGGTLFPRCLSKCLFLLYLINLAVLLRATSPLASREAGAVRGLVCASTQLPFTGSPG